MLIDPEATNIRAIHVYQKVGFKIISEFIASWHPVPHYQMELQMKDLLNEKMKKKNSPLSQEIQKTYDQLIKTVSDIPVSKRCKEMFEGTGGRISISDLIAYQIGWGKCLIRWYESGINGEQPEMPGDGFSKWDYVAIAKHFYQTYRFDTSSQQLKVFENTVARIIEITEKEQETGNLDQQGIWPWCTLSSGKKWPLSKWIRVNTVSPYKRAAQSIKRVKLL